MASISNPLQKTRASLLLRLKNWQDQASWQEFFDTYWRLIYGIARKAGLSDTEAQDAVQETMLGVAKQMPTFIYDPALGSFKAWLLTLARWRILDQFRKRQKLASSLNPETEMGSPIETLADPLSQKIGDDWEREWQQHVLEAALNHVKRKVDPQKYQVFDFYVNKGWKPEAVAKRFGISTAQVYLAKNRITEAIRQAVERLDKGKI